MFLFTVDFIFQLQSVWHQQCEISLKIIIAFVNECNLLNNQYRKKLHSLIKHQ